MQGRGGSRSVTHGGEGGVYIGEEGQPPRGWPAKVALLHFMVVNPLFIPFMVVTPSST
jgi:hypothetical protein